MQPKPSDKKWIEFSLKAVVVGLVFGVIFGAANAYLGLRVGLTVSTSIPISVLAIAVFRAGAALWGRGTILETNLAQTVGSASSSLASGLIFTIPALFLWGVRPSYLQVSLLALLGGVLGICAMIPLRRILIVQADQELPYPEGRACAEVLKAADTGLSSSQWIFIGLAVGAAIKLLLGLVRLMPSDLAVTLPGLPKAVLSIEVAPALLAVGFILGYRSAATMVSGSLISAVVLIPLFAILGDNLPSPLFPETAARIHDMTAGQIWSRYIRYIGAGAVAAAGTLTVLQSLPTMYASLQAVLRDLFRRADSPALSHPRNDQDLPGIVVVLGVSLVVGVLALAPGLLAGGMGLGPRTISALGVALFGVLFVAVSSRIVGLIGVSSNPTSGMTLVTLLGISAIFVALGWRDVSARAAVLTVGTVVCIAASKAGDISQDLKTGFLVGATPYLQQAGQLLSASVAAWAIAGTVLTLGAAYQFGSKDLPAPQATLMKTVIEGVLSGALPWGLVLVGVAFSLAGALAGLSGLAFAVGIYLPLSSMTPIFLGGLIRRMSEARRKDRAGGTSAGILCASGLIAGEGLAGIAIAVSVALFKGGRDARVLWHGPAAEGALLLLLLFLLAMLYRANARSRNV